LITGHLTGGGGIPIIRAFFGKDKDVEVEQVPCLCPQGQIQKRLIILKQFLCFNFMNFL